MKVTKLPGQRDAPSRFDFCCACLWCGAVTVERSVGLVGLWAWMVLPAVATPTTSDMDLFVGAFQVRPFTGIEFQFHFISAASVWTLALELQEGAPMRSGSIGDLHRPAGGQGVERPVGLPHRRISAMDMDMLTVRSPVMSTHDDDHCYQGIWAFVSPLMR
ncbi:hypothetical protein B0T10DRAFT_106209 [Thelonectria olida]|uniref:Uncharacterized protein n=1 Tax=Thelonectria olida TaxID=1576542 RepID=A0A9P8WFA6_9HYPO|nr:hypothetical protein B0T10DRAFT_106209 [Thelonectria olida]